MNTEKRKLIESLKAWLRNNPIESSAPIYQPIYFDEFRDIETSLNRDSFIKKAEMVLGCLPTNLSGKKVIDVGSNAGFFSFACAERGATVDALEIEARYIRLCRSLCDIYDVKNINLYEEPISINFLKNKNYDYGFMLSVFQWISEGNSKLGYAKNILMETSKHVDILFFELGCNSGKSAVKTRKINHLAYVHSLLKDNTIYKNIKILGTTKFWGGYHYRYLFICSNKDVNVKEPFYSFLKRVNI